MAKLYGEIAKSALLTLDKSFSRALGQPLDASEVYYSLAAAEAYAKTSSAYVGQKIVVIEDGKVTHYSVENAAGALKELGVRPVGDEKSITVSNAGLIELYGFNAAENNKLPMKVDGAIVWKSLEDIGAGDGNDNTTYEFELNTDKNGFIVTPKFNGQPIVEGDGEEAKQVKYELILDVYTKKEVDDAIKVLADKIGVEAAEGVEATGLYELIANEVARATKAEGDLSDRIGVAKDGEAAATGVYAYVDGVVNALVEGVDPDKIDSLNELIAWVEAHPDIVSGLDERLEKVEGILDGIGGEGEKETVVEYVGDYVTNALGAYTNTETLNGLLDSKVDDTDLNDYYTKTEVDNKGYAVAADVEKDYAKKATTLNGYGITDAYTKNEIDAKIGAPGVPAQGKEGEEGYVAPIEGTGVFANTYSKAELNALLDKIEGGSTESAASVARQLDEYKTSNNQRVKDVEDKVGHDVNGEEAATGLFLEVDQARAQADLGVVNAATAQGAAEAAQGAADAAQGTANEALGKANTNAGDILTLKGIVNGNGEAGTDGLVKRLAALEAEVGEVAESRIDALEGVTGQHTKDIGANTTAITVLNAETIPALQQAIADEADARAKADKTINDKIGAVTEGKTVVDMINAVAGTIDFTPYATNERVDAIYKVDGETKSGVLADALVDVAANKTAIALLNDTADKEGSVKHTVATELAKIISDTDADIDTLNEIAAWIINDQTGAAKMANDIAALNIKVDTGDKKVSEYVAAEIAAAAYVLPAATAEVLGGVKSASDVEGKVVANKIYVDASTNIGEVKAISTDLLVQGEFDLILNGGNASLTA